MHAWTVISPNEAADLSWQAIPKPQPGEGQIQVEVRAVGLNPVDYKLAMSGYPSWTYPHVLGLDVAGVITALGPGVTGFQLGERVAYHGDLTKPGGFADYALADARVVARIPTSVSFETAAALPCAALTAYHALTRRINALKTQTVFVNGGAGGVGSFAVQLAALLGYTVFASASIANHDYVKSLGASAVVDYQQSSMKTAILALTNGVGVDAVIDTVSKETATEALDFLAFGGHLISLLGQVIPPPVDFIHAYSITEVTLGAAYIAKHAASITDLGVMLSEVLLLVASGRLKPTIAEILTPAELPSGLAQLQTRRVRGKLVVSWS